MTSRRDWQLQQLGITQWSLRRPGALQGEIAISPSGARSSGGRGGRITGADRTPDERYFARIDRQSRPGITVDA